MLLRVLLTEVVQLAMLQQLHIVRLLHKGMHSRFSVANQIQLYVIRRSNNVCKRALNKGNNKLAHNSRLVHKCNSKGSRLVLWAVAVAQQEGEEVVRQAAVVAAIVDNR
jgi:hypothetical protein